MAVGWAVGDAVGIAVGAFVGATAFRVHSGLVVLHLPFEHFGFTQVQRLGSVSMLITHSVSWATFPVQPPAAKLDPGASETSDTAQAVLEHVGVKISKTPL